MSQPNPSPVSGETQQRRLPRASWTIGWAAGIMLIATIACDLIYLQEHHLWTRPPATGAAAVQQTEMVSRFDCLVLRARSITAGLCAVGLALASLSLARWQRAWEKQLRSKELHRRAETSGLEALLAASRATAEAREKAEAEVRDELRRLAGKHAALEADLAKRQQAENALRQQRQFLESSKTVLEVHVQARTHELQKLQRQYQMILNSAGEGICGLDLEGKITFVNPAAARMTGWSIDEALGRAEQEIFHPCGANGKDSGQQVFYRKDKSPFPVEFVRTHIAENGSQSGSVLIFKDITERKQSEETLAQKAAELTRSNAELEQFAFVASHDLQEPLRKIQAFGDRLKAKCNGSLPPDAHDYLERIQRASARMRTLIDDLLAFSRAARGDQPFAQVDLSQAARDALGDLELRIEKSGAQVEIGELPTIEADPTQMRQLLLNLLGNALKFQAPGVRPVIKVQAQKSSSNLGELFWDLTVEDNGIGFDNEYAEKIFAVFQRLHGRDEFEGTGIGLAVCRRITDRHRGRITAQGSAGKGATFTITLPARHNEPATAA